MGSFYTNVTVTNMDRDKVIGYLSSINRKSIVAPYSSGGIVIYDEKGESQDGSIFQLAEDLSKTPKCCAFAIMNHDDSVLYFQVFSNGEIVDSYNSCPSYFEGEEELPPTGGNAETLCGMYNQKGKEKLIEDILRYDSLANEDEERYIFETERHSDITNTLNLPSFAVGTGYNYITNGEYPEGLEFSDCATIGD